MDAKKLLENIKDAKFSLDIAKSQGNLVNRKRESLRNVLENNLVEIIEAVEFASKAEDLNRVLETEISDADRELKEKDDEIRALKAQLEKKKKPAKETAADVQ